MAAGNEQFKMISVELTNKEAELFKKFREYQSLWESAFKIKSGSVTLNFDKRGKIRSTDEYRHKKLSTIRPCSNP